MDRQGYYRTIGRDERAYRSFVPTPLQDIHLEMDEQMQTLLAQAHERLKNRNLSNIDALQKEEVENSVNLVYGEKKSLALAFFETDDKEDKKRKLDEQNLLQATRFAVERMQKLPISSRLLKPESRRWRKRLPKRQPASCRSFPRTRSTALPCCAGQRSIWTQSRSFPPS